MEQNSHHKDKLLIQTKEAYGRIVYTYTCHNKMINSLEKNNKRMKYLQIVLSGISTGGFIGAVIQDEYIYSIIGGACSTVLLILNLFFQDFSLTEEIDSHRKASNDLWLLREKYISFMTDFNILTSEEIRSIRDALQKETSEVYTSSPKTNNKSYKEAQKSLKDEEEQFFTNNELNQILPIHLRTYDKN